MRGAVHMLDLEDGCWALGDDGQCSLERAHGREAKPSTCRLFPVNRLLRVGDALVVDLQLTHCPLLDARAAPGPRTVIRWDEIARDLEATGTGAIAIDGRAPAGAPGDWLGDEAAARDGAGAWTPTAAAQARVARLLRRRRRRRRRGSAPRCCRCIGWRCRRCA